MWMILLEFSFTDDIVENNSSKSPTIFQFKFYETVSININFFNLTKEI